MMIKKLFCISLEPNHYNSGENNYSATTHWGLLKESAPSFSSLDFMIDSAQVFINELEKEKIKIKEKNREFIMGINWY